MRAYYSISIQSNFALNTTKSLAPIKGTGRLRAETRLRLPSSSPRLASSLCSVAGVTCSCPKKGRTAASHTLRRQTKAYVFHMKKILHFIMPIIQEILEKTNLLYLTLKVKVLNFNPE